MVCSLILADFQRAALLRLLSKASANLKYRLSPSLSNGRFVNGTYQIFTADGVGPIEALVDESAAGKSSTAKFATVTTKMPGTDGNIAAPSKRGLVGRMLVKGVLISKRAENVNEECVSTFLSPSRVS